MTSRRTFARLVFALLPGAALAAACLPGSGSPFLDPDQEDASGLDLTDGGFKRSDVDLGDPFALEGLMPSHGPFTGGTQARLSGRGFGTRMRVFVGGAEVPPSSVLASDPTRVAIVVPPGTPGEADVRIRNEDTAEERTLPKGYVYDAFVVSPDTGATSGGTRLAITGSGTAWATGTKVGIGGVPCNDVVVIGPTSIECVTPPGAPGAKDVTVETLGGTSVQAREAFTYNDSPDGYRGGLSGGALAGRIRVLALDAFLGTPLPGATVVVGSTLATGTVATTAATGVVEVSGVQGPKVTVTVTAKCHQPMTYVDVPVDTVTTYLTPVLDPACGSGDPPSIGNSGGRYGGVIEGQLVFQAGQEFARRGWTTVPAPRRPTERRAAYVFEARPSFGGAFELPAPALAITPDSPGSTGYAFSIVVYPGNASIYAVAGLEDRSENPPKFTPYAMGAVRGVSVPAQTRVTGVDLAMNVLFDKQVTVAPAAPVPGPRGPDRLSTSVSMTLGANAFALFPQATRTVPLPSPATIPFVGVPSLDNAVTGERYVLSAVAATGPDLQFPASVISQVLTTETGASVGLGGFLGVPVPEEPSAGVWSGTHVAYGGAAGPVDLALVQVKSGNGLVTWTIVAPGGVTSFDLPDLSALPGPDPLGLRPGPITTTFYVARIDGFSYGRVRQGQLSPRAFSAHAVDAVTGAY